MPCQRGAPHIGLRILEMRVAPHPAFAFVASMVMAVALAPGVASAASCPATSENGQGPPGIAAGGLFGNGRLATSAYGLILANDRTLNADGSISEKFPWFGAPSLRGDLRISGKRLDRRITRPLHARINGGGLTNAPPGTQFWSSAVTFPTTGCWRIDGQVGVVHLSLVVVVRKPRPGE